MARETGTPQRKSAHGERAVQPRPEISLGDLAQAIATLRPADPVVRDAISALLGLRTWETPAEAKTKPDPTPEEEKETKAKIVEEQLAGEEKPSPRRTHRRPKRIPAARPVRFTAAYRDDKKPDSVPAWFATYDQDKRESTPDLPPVPRQELIPPGYIRAVLARLLATPIPEGVVDVDRLVDLIARGQPVSRIPRESIPSLRQGVQILVDIDPALAPFSEDQDYLLAHIEDLVGTDNLNLLWFEGDPLRGVYGESGDYSQIYEPPPHGSKVILLTDLGIGQWTPQKSTEATRLWRRFARIIHEADAELMALVPYGSWRWPTALRGILPMLYWERFWIARQPRRLDSLPASPALRALAKRNPQALDLAKFLSLAARIDRPLLRAARLKLIPKADAGAEADLWLSPIAQSRSAASLLLMPKIAQELRQLLARDGKEAVEEAWRFLFEYRERGGISYDMRQEEYMNYLALHPERDEIQEATKLLQEALVALVKGGDRRLDVARWALRAIPRLPDTVRNLPIAGELYYAAAVRLGITPADETVLPDDLTSLDWLKPDDAGAINVGVQLVEGGLKFGRQVTPDMAEIRVTEATPILLDVSWPAVIGTDRQQVALGPAGPLTLGASSCQLATVSDDGTVRHWQVSSSQEIALFGEQERALQCIAISPDGRTLAGGDRLGNIRLWDLQSGRQRFQLQGRAANSTPDNLGFDQRQELNVSKAGGDLTGILAEGTTALAFSPDGRYLASAVAGSDVQIWLAYKGNRLRYLGTLGKPALSLAFAPHANNLMTGSDDGTVMLWDINIEKFLAGPAEGDGLIFEEELGSELMGPRREHRSPVQAVAFSPDGELAATGDVDGLVLLMVAQQGSILNTITLNRTVNDLAFNHDGTKLAVAGNRDLVVFDVENGQTSNRQERKIPCFAVAFSPDGQYLFTGHGVGEIRVIETDSLQEVSALSGHNLDVTGLIPFNPPATTFNIQTSGGRQYEIAPDRRQLSFDQILSFDHLIDGSRRSLHPEVDAALAKIDEWLSESWNVPPDNGGAFLATGGPASGKSTLASVLVEISRGERGIPADLHNFREDMLDAHYFCDESQEQTADSRHFVMSLAMQIAESLPDYGERLVAIGRREGTIPAQTTESGGTGPLTIFFEPQSWEDEPASELLQTYLVQPLAALAAENYFDELLILVSGLHQVVDALPERGESLLDLLPALAGLPPNVRFIFVTRAQFRVMVQLEPLQPERFALSPDSAEEDDYERASYLNYSDQVRQVLINNYDLEEIKTLCFILGINHEELSVGGKVDLVGELIEFITRVDRMADLDAEVRRQKPQAASQLPSPPSSAVGSRTSDDQRQYLVELYRQMANSYDEGDLRTLCFMLAYDFENLPGSGTVGKIRELIVDLSRLDRLRDLSEMLNLQKPEVSWPSPPQSPDIDPTSRGLDDQARYRIDLFEALIRSFNLSELKDLAFDLSVDFEDLLGSSTADMARELILYMERHGRLRELELAVRQQRPNIPWPDVPPRPKDEPSIEAEKVADRRDYLLAMQRLLEDNFNEEEVRTLCFVLAVDYDDLPGSGKREKIFELIQHMERLGRLTELEAEARQQRPQAPWPEDISRPRFESTPVSPELRDRMKVRGELHQFLINYFNENELRTLCFDLNVEYEALPSEGRVNKARELILHLERRGRLDELEEALKQQRPGVPWPDLPPTPGTETSPQSNGGDDRQNYLLALSRLLEDSFSEEELRTLFFDLQVDYDDIPGSGKSQKILGLIQEMERQGRLADLEAVARQQRSRAPWPERATAPDVETAATSAERDVLTSSRSTLYQVLVDYFNEEDLRTLCFDLGVRYENLPGEGKNNKARELILLMERQGRLDQLETSVRELRPKIPWPDLPWPESLPSTEARPTSTTIVDDDQNIDLIAIYKLLADNFNESELRTLTFDLNIDYEDLAGMGNKSKCRELVLYMERRGRLDELVIEMERQKPDLPWPE